MPQVDALAIGMVMGLLLWFASAWVLEQWGRRQKPSRVPDVILVAGCAVRQGRASPALRRRVQTAVALPFVNTPLLFTGGGQPSEAAVAADLARAAGTSEARLLLEEHASSTWENAVFSAHLLRTQGVEPRRLRVLVVSDAVHLLRCFLVFRREFGGVETVAAPSSGRWTLSLREVGVLVWYGLRGRLRLLA